MERAVSKNPEQAASRRRILLMVMASAFLVWQVPAMDFFERLSSEGGEVRAIVAVIGFLVWAVALVALFATGKGFIWGTNKTIRSVLEDELVKANRVKAFIFGYSVALIASVLLFTASLYWPVTGTEASHLIMVLAVVAPMYAFVWLDRDDA